MAKAKTTNVVIPDRDVRMKWWREARFGLFIHYNMFSQWMDPEYRHLEEHPEENTPEEHDRKRVMKMQTDRDAPANWVKAAKSAGMKYCVLTTKHNCGFPLWNSKVAPFNAVNYGPKRDLVADYVKACRAEGLKVGFYYALNDRHCPYRQSALDKSPEGRRNVIRFTQGLLRELMTQYGEVSILWYDEPWPLGYGGEWDSEALNREVRRLQPNILINDRSLTAQDFTCPEGKIGGTGYPDQDHESCMTFNGTWAWHPKDPSEYYTPRQIVDMLWQVTAGGGNLLLNVGPEPVHGQISELEVRRLAIVGRWLKRWGQAVYGPNDRPEALGESTNSVKGKWTKHGADAYLWLFDWTGEPTIVINKIHTKLKACNIVGGASLKFEQTPGSITIRGLPARCPDDVLGVAVLKLAFAEYPR